MSLQRAFIILSIFTCCAYVNAEGPRQVNCEVYVYHPNCRGMQAKKRFTNSAEIDKTDPDYCPCRISKKMRNNDLDALPSSKILEAMLAKGLDVNTIYDAYAASTDRRRNNAMRNRSNQRSKSISDRLADFSIPIAEDDY